jgi:hypothetical protein
MPAKSRSRLRLEQASEPIAPAQYGGAVANGVLAMQPAQDAPVAPGDYEWEIERLNAAAQTGRR